MRSLDIFGLHEARQELFEVAMSPGSLKKLSEKVHGAKIGFEFEMIVPDMSETDPDFEEPNYDYDTSAVNIEDIVTFFSEEDANSEYKLNRLERVLKDGFNAYIPEYFRQNQKDYFKGYVFNNIKPEVVANELKIKPDLFGNTDVTKDDYEKFIEQEWEDEGKYYKQTLMDFRSDNWNMINMQRAYLRKELRITTMADVMDHFPELNLEWPFMSTDRTKQLESLGRTFSKFVNMPVNVSDTYHGARRSDDAYSLEVDTSISPDGFDEAGLEFISPPLDLDEALDQLKRVKEFADKVGAYTNSSTGLHINVSVPNYNIDDLDYVKLAILLGDQYVLKQFGRYGNTYARSAIDMIKTNARDTYKVDQLVSQLKKNTEEIASKILHSGRTQKMTSINTKDNRVEFRSPGDDWLNEYFPLIEDTTRRFVVALDAACDRNKYKEEYLKGFVKLLQENDDDSKDMSLFAQYMAGKINKSEYINTLEGKKQARYKRQGLELTTAEEADEGDYEVRYTGKQGDKVLYVKHTPKVNTEKEALTLLKRLIPNWFIDPSDVKITEVTYKEIDDYQYYDMDQFGHILGKNPEDALNNLYLSSPRYFDKYSDILSKITPKLIPSREVGEYSELGLKNIRKNKNIDLMQLKRKIENNKSYFEKYKLWIANPDRGTGIHIANRVQLYVVARSNREAVDTLKRMYPDIAMIDFDARLSDDNLSEEEINSYIENQNEIIKGTANADKRKYGINRGNVDYDQLGLYIVNQTNGPTGNRNILVLAKSEIDALDIAKKIKPEFFPKYSVIVINSTPYYDITLKRNLFKTQSEMLNAVGNEPQPNDVLNSVFRVTNRQTNAVKYIVVGPGQGINTAKAIGADSMNCTIGDLDARLID